MAAADLDTILDNLNDFSDYEEVGSISRAKSFITACRRFIALPSSQSDKGSSLGYDQANVLEMMRQAQVFVRAEASAASAGGIRHLGIGRDFRH